MIKAHVLTEKVWIGFERAQNKLKAHLFYGDGLFCCANGLDNSLKLSGL